MRQVTSVNPSRTIAQTASWHPSQHREEQKSTSSWVFVLFLRPIVCPCMMSRDPPRADSVSYAAILDFGRIRNLESSFQFSESKSLQALAVTAGLARFRTDATYALHRGVKTKNDEETNDVWDFVSDSLLTIKVGDTKHGSKKGQY